MRSPTPKALAVLGGVATLVLGTSFLLRQSPKARTLHAPCAPRMLELEHAVCEPTLAPNPAGKLAGLAPQAPHWQAAALASPAQH